MPRRLLLFATTTPDHKNTVRRCSNDARAEFASLVISCHLYSNSLFSGITDQWRIQKKLSASGGLRPPDPPPGALPLDPAGGSAPRPPFRLALRALAMVRLFVCNAPSNRFFFFVSRWNRAISWPSVLHDKSYKTLFFEF